LNRSFNAPNKIFLTFVFVFVFLSRLIMPPEFHAAPKFFGDPNGPCGSAMAEKAGVHQADPSDGSNIVPLVVSESPPALSKARMMFGHPVSKANVKHLGPSTQFFSLAADLQIQLKAALDELNPAAEETREQSMARLHQL
jgi:hypothetical protein